MRAAHVTCTGTVIILFIKKITVMNGIEGLDGKMNPEKSDTTFCQNHEQNLLHACEYLNTSVFLQLGGRGICKLNTRYKNEITN